jgi:hypothetical protein
MHRKHALYIILFAALNYEVTDESKYLTEVIFPPPPQITKLKILDVEATDVAKYACRLVNSDVWAYSYVVLLGKLLWLVTSLNIINLGPKGYEIIVTPL